MRIRHSSEAVAKMQSSDIEPNNRNPDLTTFLPSFNEPPSNIGFQHNNVDREQEIRTYLEIDFGRKVS